MKTLKLTLLLTILATGLTFAQNVDMATEVGLMSKSLSPKIDANGSPYIQGDYAAIKINDRLKNYVGRYNAYNGEMEVIINDSNSPIALDLNNDYTVTFTNSKKVYKSFKFKDDNGNDHSEFLVVDYTKGDIALLTREVIKFSEAKKAKTSYGQDKKAEFVREKDEYYIQLSNGSIVPVPNKGKDLAELYPEKEDEIEDFVKDNKIKTREKGDLVKFINFMASL